MSILCTECGKPTKVHPMMYHVTVKGVIHFCSYEHRDKWNQRRKCGNKFVLENEALLEKRNVAP